MAAPRRKISPALATIASILVPGGGYFLIGERQRGGIVLIGILLLFVIGILLAGIRVVTVPGFDDDGYRTFVEIYRDGSAYRAVKTSRPVIAPPRPLGRGRWEIQRWQPGAEPKPEQVSYELVRGPRWIMLDSPIKAIGENVSVLAHVLNGPMYIGSAVASIVAAREQLPKSYSRLADIGSLYLVVSGMLNLLVIADTYSRASGLEQRR